MQSMLNTKNIEDNNESKNNNYIKYQQEHHQQQQQQQQQQNNIRSIHKNCKSRRTYDSTLNTNYSNFNNQTQNNCHNNNNNNTKKNLRIKNQIHKRIDDNDVDNDDDDNDHQQQQNNSSQYFILRKYWNKTAQECYEVGNNLAVRITNVGYIKNCLSYRNIINNNNSTIYRHSISLYTASSVILALCYLTTTAFAASESNPIFDESSSDKEILDHLLLQKRYDKRLLPPVNDTLLVTVNVLLLSLASPDESSLKYEVEFLLNQQWNDPRLEYGNKSTYSHLNALHHHNDIWLPDTYFIMHGDFKDPIIPMHFALRIFRNGSIHYAMRRHLILSCQGSLHIFPFDDPKCSFAMESISYEQKQIAYIWKNDEATLKNSPSLTTLNAYLVENATISCPIKSWRGNYSCLRVDLTFTRDRAFYFTTVFIPGIILVTSSFITFWLEWNAVPARVMIGVTTMLNFFTTSNGFRSTLPVVSNLTAMNVWDGVCMCFIYASLLEFVCVNYVGRKRPLHNVVYRPGENPVTQRLPAVLSRIGVILASPLEIIEREFVTALSSEKAHQQQQQHQDTSSGVGGGLSTTPSVSPKNITIIDTTPIRHSDTIHNVCSDIELTETFSCSAQTTNEIKDDDDDDDDDDVIGEFGDSPVRPPRRKFTGRINITELQKDIIIEPTSIGEKRKDIGGPNEIVACTSCGGGSSPCTHSANNGCATETCFVQVRKKEPPHPIRVAKTIDVIARITFPTAYAIFLIFFFVHYKGFS